MLYDTEWRMKVNAALAVSDFNNSDHETPVQKSPLSLEGEDLGEGDTQIVKAILFDFNNFINDLSIYLDKKYPGRRIEGMDLANRDVDIIICSTDITSEPRFYIFYHILYMK